LPAEINFSSKGSFLQKGCTSCLNIDMELGEKCLPGLVLMELLEELNLPLNSKAPLFSDPGFAENFRGRQFAGKTETEEIASFKGRILAPGGDPLSVNISLESFFSTFVGKGAIKYKLQGGGTSLVKEAVPEINLEQCCRLLPVRWQKVSLGLEFFRRSLLSSVFGSAPTIYKRLYVDLEERKIKIFGEESMLPQKGMAPLKEEKLTEAIQTVFKKRSLPGNEDLEKIQQSFT